MELISVLNNHTLIVNSEGELYACGRNKNGELGIGDSQIKQCRTLVPVQIPVKVASVSAGYPSFGVAVAQDGSLWSWGSNPFGCLGLGTAENLEVCAPRQIPNTSGFISVKCGECFTLALDSNGDVWGFGSNRKGQLGMPNGGEVLVPTKIESLSDIQMIAVGHEHSLALNSAGQLFSFGTMFSSSYTDNYKPVALAFDKPIRCVAAGFMHTLAVDADHDLWCIGANYYSQLGLGNTVNQFTHKKIDSLSGIDYVWCGGDSSFAKGLDGKMWVFGRNLAGRLGTGDLSIRTRPTEVPALFGMNILFAGANFTWSVDKDGNVYSFGANDNGQLGKGCFGGKHRSVTRVRGFNIFPDQITEAQPIDDVDLFPKHRRKVHEVLSRLWKRVSSM